MPFVLLFFCNFVVWFKGFGQVLLQKFIVWYTIRWYSLMWYSFLSQHLTFLSDFKKFTVTFYFFLSSFLVASAALVPSPFLSSFLSSFLPFPSSFFFFFLSSSSSSSPGSGSYEINMQCIYIFWHWVLFVKIFKIRDLFPFLPVRHANELSVFVGCLPFLPSAFSPVFSDCNQEELSQ